MASKDYNINSNLIVNNGNISSGYGNVLTGATKSSSSTEAISFPSGKKCEGASMWVPAPARQS